MSEKMIKGFPTSTGVAKYDYNHLGNIPFVAPQKYGAAGDGVTDDTEAINKCLAENSNVYFPAGIYLIDAAVGVRPQSNQVIELDANATLKANPNTTPIGDTLSGWETVLIDAVENVILRGGNIEGDMAENGDTGTDHKHGIRIRNSRNITIDGCHIFDNCGDGIIAGTYCKTAEEYAEKETKSVTVANCNIHDCARHGMTVDGIEGILVKNTEIHDCLGRTYSAAIDFEIEYTWHTMHDIKLDGVKTYNTNLGIQNSPSNVLGAFKSYEVNNCTFDRFTTSFDDPLTIRNCEVGRLHISTSPDVRVLNCKIGAAILQRTANAVYFYNCFFERDVSDICRDFTADSKAIPNSVVFFETDGSGIESTADVMFDKCTMRSHVYEDGEVKDVKNAIIYTYIPPKRMVLDGCTMYERNPCGSGNIMGREATRIVNCHVLAEFTWNNYPYDMLQVGGNAMVANNTLDASGTTGGDAACIKIGTASSDAKLHGNIVLGKSYNRGIDMSVAGTLECVNNVLRGYTSGLTFAGVNTSNVTLTKIGNITSDTAAE